MNTKHHGWAFDLLTDNFPGNTSFSTILTETAFESHYRRGFSRKIFADYKARHGKPLTRTALQNIVENQRRGAQCRGVGDDYSVVDLHTLAVIYRVWIVAASDATMQKAIVESCVKFGIRLKAKVYPLEALLKLVISREQGDRIWEGHLQHRIKRDAHAMRTCLQKGIAPSKFVEFVEAEATGLDSLSKQCELRFA